MIDRTGAKVRAEAPAGAEHWPVVIRGSILVAGVVTSWGLALTALHLI